MNKAEKAYVVLYWAVMLVYVPCVILMGRDFTTILLPFNLSGMLIGIPVLVAVFVDLYRRDFPDPNAKVTWAILMLMFWPSIFVYLHRHGFKARKRARAAQ